jgi:two-component system chemotaxis sensor kinase CheA
MKFDRSLFVEKFSLEAQEHLQNLNQGVLRLERGEFDADLAAEILRAAHTLKGSARMMGFKEINLVAHKLEDLLLEVKEERLTPDQRLCDLIFRALDTMDASRQAIVEGREGEVEVDELVRLLERAAQQEPFDLPPAGRAAPPVEPAPLESAAAPAVPPEQEPPAGEPGPARPLPETAAPTPMPPARQPPHPPPAVATEDRIRVSAAKVDKTIRLTGEVIAAQRRAEMRQADLRQAWLLAKDHRRLLRRHLSLAAEGTRLEAGRSLDGALSPQMQEILDSGQALHDRLDALVKQNREDIADLGGVVLELQQDTLGLRMLPVSTVFDTFPRAVRDLARERNKELDLIVEGADTELDKQMLERISDPLMHMLRNAVDHGMEPPEERVALGKHRRGKIWLRAFPMWGNIVIEVEDDGRGLDPNAIRAKALQVGVVSEEKLRTMSDRELQSLIFLSGFSTSETVSDISGRGVGLDVVRRNIIEELKGDISVDTERSRGTRFTLTLPLTLTTLRILFVCLGPSRFGLPITYIAETTRVRPEEVIQVVDRQAIRLRDQLVPIAWLGQVLRLPGAAPVDEGLAGPDGRQWIYLVIAQVADERVAFVVDEVADEEDVLIKPLPGHMKRIGLLAGATITPGGQIVPILHIPGLIRTVRTGAAGRAEMDAAGPSLAELGAPQILVVDDSLNTREIEKSILEAQGYRVDLARDGLDALRMIDQAPAAEGEAYYDLLIVDIEMPRMDGLSLTEQLRTDSRYARVPIVIVSSRDKEEDRRRGLAVGADAYIVKGTFDQEELTRTVASLLGRAAPQP